MKTSGKGFQLYASDLANHLGCRHLTQLNRSVALGELKKPTWHDPSLDILIERGREHEAAYVAYLKEKGLKILDLTGQPIEATYEAMKKGIDVLVQPALADGQWAGFADVVLKVPGKSKFGDWSYEVQDTKLAQQTRASAILQLCLYTELVSVMQESVPENMYIVKPGSDFPDEKYRYAEFQSYYHLVKKNFERVMAGPALSTYPEPAEHCGICRWWQQCDKRRHEDDHLSLVAGIRSLHIVELQRQKIETLEQFAHAETLEKPERGNRETFIRKQSQAKIQLRGRHQNKLLYDLLPNESGRGLNRLPVPNEGDIYFDIEGDAFYEDGGLEYVLGYAYQEKGTLVYKSLWSANRREEKKAFAQFMHFVTDRWKRYPHMYIYHFAPYESSAIKRLARVHASFETEVDDLLRANRFVDLHAVFKEAMLASVEVYSLKELEKFTHYTRKVALHDASSARKSVEVALERHQFDKLSPETIRTVQDYNEDDCLATEALHRWLEERRETLVKAGKEFQRPALETGEASEHVQQKDIRAQALFNVLTAALPEDKEDRNEEHNAKWLLAHQIDYFRREDKSAWWEYFRVHELEHEALLDERKAIAGLEFIEALPKEKKERNPTHRYRYPPQEISLAEGDELVEVKGEKIGSVKAISVENYTIDIKKAGNMIEVHPIAIHTPERVNPEPLATTLMDLAEAIDEYGLTHAWPYHASKDLLMKRKPRLLEGKEGAYVQDDEDTVAAAIRIALNLDHSVLAIQGPPGSGKTYTGARMILALANAGKKIGITAVSHKVIRNLTLAAIKQSREQKVDIRFVHKINEKSSELPEEITEITNADKGKILAALEEGTIVCGTAWLWADKNAEDKLDYLFIDEAGQMSLSQALAASRAARNLILLGDPQQLEQPQKGSHPEGSDVAALTYLLDGQPTMPEGQGLFLGVTRRLHPAICRFTSEIFYEGRLTALPGLEKQVIQGNTPFDGAGLFYVPVKHKGNQSKAPEEVEVIARVVKQLLANGTWTDDDDQTHPLKKKDIMIVAPYNAQVSALREQLPDIEAGTVDKFQGQEAPVVIYSMTSSTPEDVPRGMGFLYNPNRLNVATSRARCICILVASPELLEPECHTIEQMRWANALCRYKELATEVVLE